MARPTLYAITLDETPVTVRAIVFIPSASESAEGDTAEADICAVGGVDVRRLPGITDDEWDTIAAAVIEQERERRAAGREAAAG